MRYLWDGELKKREESLQLLYIIDIIAIWAEHTYKPSICLCLASLEARMKGGNAGSPSDLEQNSCVQKLELNKTNFPWLLNPRWNIFRREELAQTDPQFHNGRSLLPVRLSLQPDTRNVSRTRSVQPSLQETSPNRSRRSLSQNLDLGRSDKALPHTLSPVTRTVIRSPSPNVPESISRQVLPPSSEDEYIDPDLHNYIWIQDKNPGCTDLLVLNINQRGIVSRPIVIFDWDPCPLSRLVCDERFRWHSSVDARFLYDDNQTYYLRKLLIELLNSPRGSEIQFCVIFPLDQIEYRDSNSKASDNDNVFRSIEDLLDIPYILHSIRRSAESWYDCTKDCYGFDPDTIICDNVNCKIGRFHLECLGMDDGDFSDASDEACSWLCEDCEESEQSNHLYSKEFGSDSEDELDHEIIDRVLITKAIASVWNKHKWPKKDKLVKEMEKISRMIELDSSVKFRIPKNESGYVRNPPGCWAVSRNLEKKPTMIKVGRSGLGVGIESGS
jgi:hypothetical protein